MPSNKNVQNTLNRALMRDLHRALIEIVSAMNRPQQDDELVRAAGISLDRALFRPLVTVERMGPIGIVELAERVGLDYTTVSRQISKLESLGLIARRGGSTDRRVREAMVTAKGKAMTDKIDAARERMAGEIFATWEEKEVAHFVRLMCRFAEAFRYERKGRT